MSYCPQSNGKAERFNRTLIEKARCMMKAANIPQYLWTAAVETATTSAIEALHQLYSIKHLMKIIIKFSRTFSFKNSRMRSIPIRFK